MSKYVTVVIPEINAGPPMTRWCAERRRVVTEGEAAVLIRDHGARVVSEAEVPTEPDEDLSSLTTTELRDRLDAAGIDESTIEGSGAGGRVINADRIAALEAAAA